MRITFEPEPPPELPPAGQEPKFEELGKAAPAPPPKSFTVGDYVCVIDHTSVDFERCGYINWVSAGRYSIDTASNEFTIDQIAKG